MHTASFDFGCLRILVLVDKVLVDAEVHNTVKLRLLPGLAEGSQVLTSVAIQHQFVSYHGKDVAGVALFFRELVFGHAGGEIDRGVDRVGKFMAYGIFVM